MGEHKVRIEVTPRSGDGEYHTSIGKTWSCGSSVEMAVIAVLRTCHTELGLSTKDLRRLPRRSNSRAELRELIAEVEKHGYEVEVVFIPTQIR